MNKASKIVMLGMAGLMAATSLGAVSHAAAPKKDMAKDKMAKEMVLVDEIRISGHAKAVLADVRGARFALFDGQTDAALDLVKKARSIFNDKLAKFAIKFGENKGFGAPIDRSIQFAEGFKPTKTHADAIGKAGVLAQHGKTGDAVKMMKAAGVDLAVKYALLEAMAERQVTVAGKTYPLPELFMVMATQNPIEQEGTYPLPEAQLDRFLLHVNIDYPDAAAEREILRIVRGEAQGEHADPEVMIPPSAIASARQAALQVHASDALTDYIIQIIQATRNPALYGEDLAPLLAYGASPRSTIALDRCSRVHAWMCGSEFVTPMDVQAVAHDVLRHRIILSFEAEADGHTRDAFISDLINRIPVS